MQLLQYTVPSACNLIFQLVFNALKRHSHICKSFSNAFPLTRLIKLIMQTRFHSRV